MKIPSVEELAKVGLHYGHREGRWHPTMKPFIYGSEKNVHLIDLEKTREKLKTALDFISDLAKDKKKVLLVGTKVRVGEIVKKVGDGQGLFYVDNKWLGGMLTNFKTIKKNIKKMEKMETDLEKGELDHYTKRERNEIGVEIKELNQIYNGIREMKKIPDAIIVLDARIDNLAVREASRLGIPVVALVDTNIDISKIDYPVPGNDDAIKAVQLIADLIGQAYSDGLTKETKKKTKKKEK